MRTYLSTADVVARAVPGIQHKVTVIRKLEAGELCGFQSKKGGRWAIPEACLDAFVQGALCEHKANVIPFGRRSA